MPLRLRMHFPADCHPQIHVVLPTLLKAFLCSIVIHVRRTWAACFNVATFVTHALVVLHFDPIKR